MTSQLLQSAAHYFDEQLGVTFEALLTPIDNALPAGKSIRGNGVYSVIEKARRQDDASLPMGGWEHDLKRADWARVSSAALDALQSQSKDMQLVAWLLEAQIHQRGFASIGPCMVLMDNLFEYYWDTLHPQIEDGDLDFRANILRWISEKLLSALRLVPITSTQRETEYSWSDWEQARRNEQLKENGGNRNGDGLEGITLNEFNAGINATPTEAYLTLQHTLVNALDAIDTLNRTIDERFGDEAPSLASMTNLLEQILSLADGELHKRGIRPPPEIPAQDCVAEASANAIEDSHPAHVVAPIGNAVGPIRDRADAYARLAETADFLMRLEPHSPVPYLVRRATDWGRLNTVELYQELFLKLGGQLNIFEMLGLEAQSENNTTH